MVGHAIIRLQSAAPLTCITSLNTLQGQGLQRWSCWTREGNGPKPNGLGTYRLVAFTREPYNESEKEPTAFNQIERRICGIFTDH
jgi:hypothetical protein